jgi:DNA-binding transcriptional MerR regulator/methylmalonyl-CoA mutase cobalamin-binding subunit
MTITLSIAEVERDTGLSKDTLRVWERRYGFPKPRRDAFGERTYASAQVEKLQVIKRLMDAGHRPGRIVARSLDELRALSDAPPGSASPDAAARDAELTLLLAAVRQHDAAALQQGLAVAQARHGLRAFVMDIVAPLSARVGEAWMRGELRVFEEHLFTECVRMALHAALHALPAAAGPPRVLLATLPGEPHGLGLLMAQTLMALEGCACLSLGVQVPLADLADAAAAWRADIVALSATGTMMRNLLLTSLGQLRSQLPPGVALWVGGSATAISRRAIEGVTRVPSLAGIGEALARWRAG